MVNLIYVGGLGWVESLIIIYSIQFGILVFGGEKIKFMICQN